MVRQVAPCTQDGQRGEAARARAPGSVRAPRARRRSGVRVGAGEGPAAAALASPDTPASRGFTSEHPAATDAQGAGEVEICYALIAAARRWYANSACRDAQVQANLARLALLH